MTQLSEKIYKLLKQIPKGKITTYKELGVALNTKAYRAIGQILRVNPNAPIVPCHRVIASDGSIGGYMGKAIGETIQRKIALLKKEGVEVKKNKIVDFEKVLYRFS